RILFYEEHLQIQQAVQPTSGPFVPGTQIQSIDTFGARNVFNGVDVGLRGEFDLGNLSVELLAKLAAGYVDRQGNVGGTQVVSVPGAAPVASSGGLLALPSNIGSISSNVGTILPELGVTLGWQVTSQLRLRAGYSVLWLLDAFRPGDQVDLTVNPGLIPPATAAAGSPQRPVVKLQSSDFWVQALSFGFEFRY